MSQESIIRLFIHPGQRIYSSYSWHLRKHINSIQNPMEDFWGKLFPTFFTIPQKKYSYTSVLPCGFKLSYEPPLGKYGFRLFLRNKTAGFGQAYFLRKFLISEHARHIVALQQLPALLQFAFIGTGVNGSDQAVLQPLQGGSAISRGWF